MIYECPNCHQIISKNNIHKNYYTCPVCGISGLRPHAKISKLDRIKKCIKKYIKTFIKRNDKKIKLIMIDMQWIAIRVIMVATVLILLIAFLIDGVK